MDSLNNRPIGLDDGDDDTQYTAGAGIAISGTNPNLVSMVRAIPLISPMGMTIPSTPQGRVSPFQVPTWSVSMVVPLQQIGGT